MPRKPKPAPDDPEQLKRFKEMAREVEADESEGALDRAFNKIDPSANPHREPSDRAPGSSQPRHRSR